MITAVCVGTLVMGSSLRGQHREVPVPDYGTYAPAGCLEAALRTTTFQKRARPDTARFDPTVLGRPHPAAVAVARTCVARFSVKTVDPRELLSLVTIYGMLDNDTLANAAADRWIDTESRHGLTRRVLAISGVVQVHFEGCRLALAATYLRRLDTMAEAESGTERVALHTGLATLAQDLSLDSLAAAEADTAIAIARRVTGATGQWAPRTRDEQKVAFYVSSAYNVLASAAFMREYNPAAAIAVLARAGEEFGPAVAQQNEWMVQAYRLINTPAPRLTAQYWFGVSGDSVRPPPGKVSLIVFGIRRTGMAALARLHQRFPATHIVIIRGTRGSFRGDGMLEPAAEAERLWRYTTDELKFTGDLGVTQTAYDRIPDGRRRSVPSSVEAAYNAVGGDVTVVVDQRGVIRQIFGVPNGANELAIEKLLLRLEQR